MLDQGEVEISQLIETQKKLKRRSKELHRKLQNVEDEQVGGWGMVMSAPNAHCLTSCCAHRILHLYAEKNAIDDTVYHLSMCMQLCLECG